jgi:hypothetical protein
MDSPWMVVVPRNPKKQFNLGYAAARAKMQPANRFQS